MVRYWYQVSGIGWYQDFFEVPGIGLGIELKSHLIPDTGKKKVSNFQIELTMKQKKFQIKFTLIHEFNLNKFPFNLFTLNTTPYVHLHVLKASLELIHFGNYCVK